MTAQIISQFGFWTVINQDPVKSKLLCKCVCGTEKLVNKYNLRDGKTKSCGCKLSGPIKHGHSRTHEYTVWKGMKARCSNPNHKSFDRYGGRGISVCKRWMESFEDFLLDMGKRPSNNHSIDRADGTGDYSKDNCSWETQKTQMQHTSRSVLVTVKGVTRSVEGWAECSGILSSTIYHRISAGWDRERAVTEPPRMRSASQTPLQCPYRK